MTAGSLPKLHPATLSYRPPLRLTQIGAFWCLADRCQRDFPALSDMHWTAMAGSKQSHGSLINDLCPLMVDSVVPQRLLFLLFAEGPIEDLVLLYFSRSSSKIDTTAPIWFPNGTNCNLFLKHIL